jgi:putative transposase
MDYQHDRHSVHLLVYHLIFCPKRRRRVLVGPVKIRLTQIITQVITEQEWQLIELAIQPDHVHLFVRTTPSTLPSDIPRLIKGRSSRLLRKEFTRLRTLPTLWSPSYFLSTAGNVSSETIQHSIQQQSEN